jgi:hypothetical protein
MAGDCTVEERAFELELEQQTRHGQSGNVIKMERLGPRKLSRQIFLFKNHIHKSHMYRDLTCSSRIGVSEMLVFHY